MKINKVIDVQTSFGPTETYWWLHNEVNYNRWDKKTIIVKEKEWLKFIKDNFNTLQTDFRYVNQEKPFELDIYRGYSKTEGLEKKLLISYTPSFKSKDELTISVHLYWDPSLDALAQSMVSRICELMVYNVNKSHVYMVIQDGQGLDLNSFDINIPELDIELNYGKEWAEKHDYLLKALSRENKKGIALLHGLPGTGKSMYIRYLISLLAENRTMIYLPNQLINSLTDPSFLPLMANYPNSVLIIEDAEEVIRSRKSGGTSVDKILNLSDGILSDFLGTQIICTFNSDVDLIDEALLRKGRLILKHEFKKLSIEDAQKLADKLEKGIKVTGEMTVSEIYNVEEPYSEEVKGTQKIGFN
jgi:hypothetical protein